MKSSVLRRKSFGKIAAAVCQCCSNHGAVFQNGNLGIGAGFAVYNKSCVIDLHSNVQFRIGKRRPGKENRKR